MSRRTHCASDGISRSLSDAAPRADPPDLHGVRRLGRASAVDRLEPLGLRPLQQAEQGLRLPAELEEAPLLAVAYRSAERWLGRSIRTRKGARDRSTSTRVPEQGMGRLRGYGKSGVELLAH